ncbi:DNA-binding response OmpR family regulator [Clostridium saccharoperbutylacetonicum]|uniref:Stage 0 sporulation protein A homolog n=1 Tax=Clostridium saccharoperbutylacetonicum N1-4(HMT) TaxID=931276 RepID=M1MHW8_9CLOT|nr:response regulator transcription factor [Clostridium saccharoperbutylacetonicum]AGF57524.1 Two component transcriptional regulator, winged helix family [Clostridium saccharoperbutylacetonicum N1-4(HMT)]NRT61708.1 DNA-binding response OmpR family regulator [Clostridium saccharoperbutylacetonicum]NSB25032.1 DNA-binding response OmpR family regulator [Clostridium saccharoperbutylacetonicum]NSB44402.1 DNA-binding response OmpR family regulator [Clostridium saccharoperbutylacetonicum]
MLEEKKVIIVDDENKIVEVIKSYLEKEGAIVFEAYDGNQALEVFERINPDLIVLDLMLPDMTGEEICNIVRKKSRVPIIMLTAKIDEKSIISGLHMGADDYITKPFSPRELIARIYAIFRRLNEEVVPLSNEISFNDNDLVFDMLKKEIRKNGENIALTSRQYKILMTLLKYPNKTFTREELISNALGDDYDGYDRNVDTHVKNIRQKIETNPKDPQYIITVHGTGYRFGGKFNEEKS